MKDSFYINHNKFQNYSDKAIDWYLKSRKFKRNSDEWQICILKKRIYNKEAIKYLKKAVKEIEYELK